MTSEWKTWKGKERRKTAVNRNYDDDKEQPKISKSTLKGRPESLVFIT